MGEDDGGVRRGRTMEIENDGNLKMTHKAMGAEVRHRVYDVLVDGQRAGSVRMNETIEMPVEPGRHTL